MFKSESNNVNRNRKYFPLSFYLTYFYLLHININEILIRNKYIMHKQPLRIIHKLLLLEEIEKFAKFRNNNNAFFNTHVLP